MGAHIFATVFVALYVGHHVGDHWTQTHGQACGKGAPTAAGRRNCLAHVVSLTLTKVAALALAAAVTGIVLPLHWAAGALLVDAASHYWADRSAHHQGRVRPVTLERLAVALRKHGFYQLGDRTAAPTGTGAYALDQSWHLLWIFLAALAITAGATL